MPESSIDKYLHSKLMPESSLDKNLHFSKLMPEPSIDHLQLATFAEAFQPGHTDLGTPVEIDRPEAGHLLSDRLDRRVGQPHTLPNIQHLQPFEILGQTRNPGIGNGARGQRKRHKVR